MTRRPWLPGELRILRARYGTTPTDKLARILDRPVRSLYAKANSLGLAKEPEYFEQGEGGRLRKGDTRGIGSRFQPGQKPWNTGMKGWKSGGRSEETRFKPGRPAQESHNYLPVGTTRRHKSDYLEKKITDDPGIYPAKRWVAVHRLVWEAAHGPVPKGHVVTFRAGMKTLVEAEITLDRLELITRRELMLRNSHHSNYPPEVSEVIRLRAVLTRKIRNREHRHEQNDQRPA